MPQVRIDAVVVLASIFYGILAQGIHHLEERVGRRGGDALVIPEGFDGTPCCWGGVGYAQGPFVHGRIEMILWREDGCNRKCHMQRREADGYLSLRDEDEK